MEVKSEESKDPSLGDSLLWLVYGDSVQKNVTILENGWLLLGGGRSNWYSCFRWLQREILHFELRFVREKMRLWKCGQRGEIYPCNGGKRMSCIRILEVFGAGMSCWYVNVGLRNFSSFWLLWESLGCNSQWWNGSTSAIAVPKRLGQNSQGLNQSFCGDIFC